MTYPVLKLTLPHAAIEATIGVLARFHYTSLWEEGTGDRTILHVCFAATITPAALRDCCARCVATNPRDISGVIEMVPPYDWSNQWKEFFRPIEITPGIVVTADAAPQSPAAARKIVIQPGMAFGTGQHMTTQLVARAIATGAPVRHWTRLLDIGTGSGILAMVAVACGVPQVDAVDNDPEAVRVARENIATNGMEGQITIAPDLAHCPGPYPCIAANILLEPLCTMAHNIATRLAPGGDCLLSGVLIDQVDMLQTTYTAAGLATQDTITCGEWALLHCRKSATH